MEKETKDLILSHIPLYLTLIAILVGCINRDQSIRSVIGRFMVGFLIIVQGLVYIFKRKVFLKSSYLVLWEKIVIGLMYIGVGLYWIIKYFNTIQLMVITLLQGS